MGIFDRILGKNPDKHGRAHAHPRDDAHVPQARPGAKHDPVCDMWVDAAKAPARSEHQGETVHFCSPGCKRAFDADPARYMAKLKRG